MYSPTLFADVLKGNERIANYDAKRLGHPLKQADFGIRLDGELLENKFAVVIDNVIDRGTTASQVSMMMWRASPWGWLSIMRGSRVIG